MLRLVFCLHILQLASIVKDDKDVGADAPQEDAHDHKLLLQGSDQFHLKINLPAFLLHLYQSIIDRAHKLYHV